MKNLPLLLKFQIMELSTISCLTKVSLKAPKHFLSFKLSNIKIFNFKICSVKPRNLSFKILNLAVSQFAVLSFKISNFKLCNDEFFILSLYIWTLKLVIVISNLWTLPFKTLKLLKVWPFLRILLTYLK
jgi:hypothetical protein